MRERIDHIYSNLDTSDLETNVERGAKLLDEKVPNWATTVQTSILEGLFEMSAWESCVVGQLELIKYEEGNELSTGSNVIAFNGTAIAMFGPAIYALGFDLPKEMSGEQYAEGYAKLEELWRREVEARVKS